ncbi:putaive esterase/lipase [Mycobacterium phage PP]|uniref:Putaive esterase/lipase n=1 Tax=Mycobacterium phage PP TaxID=2077134 RepID=A0A2Z5XVI4_9CAUD|nr:putaive esterase/lipase [Mycobacterium phage PP]BBC53859.1 putaive esterase/lipase [Mycobacterium phage PP]
MNKHTDAVRREFVKNQRRSLVVWVPGWGTFARYQPCSIDKLVGGEGVRHHYDDLWRGFFNFEKESFVCMGVSGFARFTNKYPSYTQELIA